MSQRLSINLSETPADALAESMVLSEANQTATVGKALTTYRLLLRAQAAGGALYMQEHAGAELERIRLL